MEVFDLRMIHFFSRTVDAATGKSEKLKEIKNPNKRAQVVMKNRTNQRADILVETWLKSELNENLREIALKGMPANYLDDSTAVVLIVGRAQFKGSMKMGSCIFIADKTRKALRSPGYFRLLNAPSFREIASSMPRDF